MYSIDIVVILCAGFFAVGMGFTLLMENKFLKRASQKGYERAVHDILRDQEYLDRKGLRHDVSFLFKKSSQL